MAYQSTYTQFIPAGFPGQMANMEEWNGMTRIATAAIPFGTPGQRSGDTQVAPLASGGEFLGVAIAHHVYSASATPDGYGQYDNVPLADEGVFFALADAAIVVGVALNFNTVSNRWTTAAVSGTVIAVPGAEADSAASGAGVLFKVRLRRVPS